MSDRELRVIDGENAGELVLLPQRLPLLPDCVCGGRRGGYLVVDKATGREYWRTCAGCSSRRLVRQFGGEVRTWASWEQRPELEAEVTLLRAWRGVGDDGDGWSCVLHAAEGVDNYGAGKSHALQATGHEWAARNVRVRYIDVPGYLERLRKSMGTDDTPPTLDGYPGLLILDDIGVGPVSAWVQNVLETVCNYRYRYGLPTLIATNKSMAELEVDLPRLVDRLHQGPRLEWSAPSWRRQ